MARVIPGVARYQDREGLRETDKQVRVHLADLLGNLARILEGAARRLTEARRLDRLPALDQVARRVSTLADRIRYASYGFAGVFDLHKIRETQLAALHRFDLDLMETIPRLRQPLMALDEAATDEATFPQALQAVESALQDFDNRLAERETVARSLWE
ncbi:MAG TPA: hypothetical protein VLG48_04190 [Candidatus Methylomirabilis sp.]|nr:hypothetical protein [Candidatus Methylomirabilis sp.]